MKNYIKKEMKINDQIIKLDIKTVIKLITLTALFVGMYYTIESDIELQKNNIEILKEDIEHVEESLKDLRRDISTLKPKRK